MQKQLSVMEEMRRNQALCDAVIRVQGSLFNVHKVMMCCCSPFFKALFSSWSTPDNNIFDIPIVSAEAMGAFIQFAYTGKVQITKDNIDELFIAADCFCVDGLVEECCRIMVETLSPDNCLKTWWLTEKYYYPTMRNRVFSYILGHFEEVAAHPSFLQLSLEDLMQFIQSDVLKVHKEQAVFEAVLLWISHQPQDSRELIEKTLPQIRLAFMDTQYFSTHVMQNKLIQQSRGCNAYLIQAMKQMLDYSHGYTSSSSTNGAQIQPRVPRTVLMAIGGWNIIDPTNAIEVYNSHTKRWVRIANPDRTLRAYHGVAFLDGFVYVIGGFDGVEKFSTMHKYSLDSQTWEEAAPMHSSRCYVSVVHLDGLIYAIGGRDDEGRLKTAERYSPQFNQWTMIASMHERRSDAGAAGLNGKIYIFGGYDGDDPLFTAESYNPENDQWSVISPMTNFRSGLSAVANAGEIYVVGGFNGLSRLNTMEVYNPRTDSWRVGPPLLTHRSNFGMAVLNDEMFVVGGYDGFNTITCVEKFTFKTGLWSCVSDMSVSRSALACCVVSDLPNMDAFSGHAPSLHSGSL
ncbi:unnamed protein product [Knipowitschia caucasica]|uniref:BTB domain-containing protein n=1 Tax=Knipowitschia caucasica TaxID=637954 RepID=A0AAV2L1R0_KNICA